MRKYNKDMKDAYGRWLEEARMFLKVAKHNDGEMEVSANDVYQAIVDAKLAPPPKGSDPRAKRDMMMAAIFLPSYYRNTGRKVAGIKPESKGRKIVIWEYMPEESESSSIVAKGRNFMADTGSF
jgi:hypothetical protein